MSLDNVIAIAGASKGDLVLVVFGLLLSLPLVVWGSGLLAMLMNRSRWIVWLGGGVLGYVAGDMILKDPWAIAHIGGVFATLHRFAPWVLALGVAFLGWRKSRDTGRRANF